MTFHEFVLNNFFEDFKIRRKFLSNIPLCFKLFFNHILNTIGPFDYEERVIISNRDINILTIIFDKNFTTISKPNTYLVEEWEEYKLEQIDRLAKKIQIFQSFFERIYIVLRNEENEINKELCKILFYSERFFVREIVDDCPICLNNLKDGIKLLGCNHVFCKECINKWFEQSGKYSCVMCRNEITSPL